MPGRSVGHFYLSPPALITKKPSDTYFGYMVLRPTRENTIGRTVITPSAIKSFHGCIIEANQISEIRYFDWRIRLRVDSNNKICQIRVDVLLPMCLAIRRLIRIYQCPLHSQKTSVILRAGRLKKTSSESLRTIRVTMTKYCSEPQLIFFRGDKRTDHAPIVVWFEIVKHI